MAPRGRRRYARRAPKESRWSIYGKATKQLAQDAYKGVQMVKQLVNTEFDFKDTTTGVSPTSGGSMTLLNGMTQGDTASSREGNSIRMKSLDLRFYLTNNSTAVNTNTRVMLVHDKQPNGSTALVTDVLATNNVVSPRNLDNRKRFKVIYDRTFSLSTAGPSNLNSAFYKKDFNQHVAFYNASNAGTIADISTGALFLLLLSDQAVNAPTINYYFRLRFIDN